LKYLALSLTHCFCSAVRVAAVKVQRASVAGDQGLTLVHISAQRKRGIYGGGGGGV
jgi:hypothetical protein